MKNMRHLSVLAVVLIIALYSEASTASIEGKVIRVADGDTITVLDSSKVQHSIRLAGIDAPERSQPFSNRSKQNLSSLVFGKAVVVEFGKTDRYGTLVGKVIVNGRDVCLEQVKAGFAWVYRQYEHELSTEDRRLYNEAESSARAGKSGLWSDPSPQPPWDIRHPSATAKPATATPVMGPIIGNKRSGIYHRPDCPDYSKIAPPNREFFSTREAAERAGYRKARLGIVLEDSGSRRFGGRVTASKTWDCVWDRNSFDKLHCTASRLRLLKVGTRLVPPSIEISSRWKPLSTEQPIRVCAIRKDTIRRIL